MIGWKIQCHMIGIEVFIYLKNVHELCNSIEIIRITLVSSSVWFLFWILFTSFLGSRTTSQRQGLQFNQINIFENLKRSIQLMLTLGVLLALFHNFGFQMLLVGQDVALPLCYCLLFTNPNGISNLKISFF